MSFKESGTKTRPERVKPMPPPSATANTGTTTSARRFSTSSTSSTSSTASFHSAHNNPYTAPRSSSPSPSASKSTPAPPVLRFTPSEENLHLSASNDLKSQANTHFSRGDFSSAISTYDRAIAELPVYLDYELAVLQSNIAACHIRLEEWKEAVAAAEKGWEGLERIALTTKKDKSESENEADAVVELPDGDEDEKEVLRKLDLDEKRRGDIVRIRTKILLRRARGRYMLATSTNTSTAQAKKDKNPFSQAQDLTSDSATSTSAWSNLTSAQSDYNLLATPEYFKTLPSSDQKTVRSALAVLPGMIETAKEKEVAEMMGKLKELGNGILRPFGLSTDMFKMDKDPNTGGMSLRFDGGAKEK